MFLALAVVLAGVATYFMLNKEDGTFTATPPVAIEQNVYKRAMLMASSTITVQFKLQVPELQIISLKHVIENLGEVKSIDYTSAEVAFDEFRRKNANNTLIINELNKVKYNPLHAQFKIYLKSPPEKEKIISLIEREDKTKIILTFW